MTEANPLTEAMIAAMADGVSRSSMLASSLANRMSSDHQLMIGVIQHIDPDVMATALAKEMVRLSMRSTSTGSSFRSMMERVEARASIHLAKLMHDDLKY